RTSSSGSGGIRTILWLLRLRTQVDPFDVARELHLLAGDPRDQVYVSVEVVFAAHRGIDKSGIETLHYERGGDALPELGQRVPDHTLLLYVKVVKGSGMAPRSHHQVAGGERGGMWYGDHKCCRYPGVFWRDRTK